MPHFFVARLDDRVVRLSLQDSRHALRSLRVRVGEEVSLADDRGGIARGRLAGEEEGLAVVEVLEATRTPRPRPSVTVALAPPSGDRLGWAVQKLAELGVDELILLETDRSVRRWRDGAVARALARFENVAREAAMQSRRPFVMRIAGVRGVVDAGAVQGDAFAVLLWERGERPLSSVWPDDPREVRVLVGPEGGFTRGEVDDVERAGGVPASLGPGTLRSETAAVVGASLALARYGRLG